MDQLSISKWLRDLEEMLVSLNCWVRDVDERVLSLSCKVRDNEGVAERDGQSMV